MVLYVLAEPIFPLHKNLYLLCIYKYAGAYCVVGEDTIEKSGKPWYDNL